MSDEQPNINEILARAGLQSIERVTKPVLDTIRNAWLKAKTRSGFTPTPEEAVQLKSISEIETYKSFKSCIGATPYLRFIKVGLLLYQLMTDGNLERIKQIKDEIYNSEYNKTAIKIIHIASTGVLLNVLEYVVNIRDERGLSKYAVSLEFEKIIDLWQSVSLPVKKEDTVELVVSAIIKKVEENPPLIVLYASQSAVKIAHMAVAEVRTKDLCKKYHPWSKNLYYKGLEQYICIFYRIEGEWETPFG
ncbi:MAG: hypothetical protein V1702_02010 [Candidatus Woesearchaeota archaeon]